MKYFLLIVGFLLVLSGNGWATDLWDLTFYFNDDTAAGTGNTLWHTAPPQIHDVEAVGGVADQDWFIIRPQAGRSYEVQVLNIGDALVYSIGGVRRYNNSGTTVLQESADLGPPWLRTLRWMSATDSDERIRVMGTDYLSTPYSQYTIQFFETTLFCPRFNNSGTQVSILIIRQTNSLPLDCNYTAIFYDENGLFIANAQSILSPNSMTVLPLSSLLQGYKGSANIAHTCGYGGIAAKLVALEPSTGFSFDTPCSYLPR